MRRRVAVVPLLAAVAFAAGCGTEGVDLPADETASIENGAEIFYNRCGACHTLSASGQQGSSSDVNSREYKDGPNFDQRVEERDQVLYAIRNGGFSSGPMPQNIVVGQDAEDVADFVAKYSGSEVARAPATGQRDEPQGLPGGENPVPSDGG
jgi:mono/diheme cytochrome c family protein